MCGTVYTVVLGNGGQLPPLALPPSPFTLHLRFRRTAGQFIKKTGKQCSLTQGQCQEISLFKKEKKKLPT